MKATEAEILEVFAEALEVEASSLRPERALADVPEWDSIAWLTLISMVDERWHLVLGAAEIKGFVTVSDVSGHLLAQLHQKVG